MIYFNWRLFNAEIGRGTPMCFRNFYEMYQNYAKFYDLMMVLNR